ncbi:MAG TPA: hypothetical protein VK615_14220 [Candidatus Binatia bacterium]|nr:hypothetical protein [Candidatus Binatia bacterium]
MDRAALLGTKARSLDRSVIEPEVADFASQSASPQKKEVVAWFLSAFWTPDSEPDGALVRLLCDWFESAPPPAADVRDALILALAAAYPAKIDPALKQKIYRIFQSLDSIANQKRQESVIVAAVQRVLRSK